MEEPDKVVIERKPFDFKTFSKKMEEISKNATRHIAVAKRKASEITVK